MSLASPRLMASTVLIGIPARGPIAQAVADSGGYHRYAPNVRPRCVSTALASTSSSRQAALQVNFDHHLPMDASRQSSRVA